MAATDDRMENRALGLVNCCQRRQQVLLGMSMFRADKPCGECCELDNPTLLGGQPMMEGICQQCQ